MALVKFTLTFKEAPGVRTDIKDAREAINQVTSGSYEWADAKLVRTSDRWGVYITVAREYFYSALSAFESLERVEGTTVTLRHVSFLKDGETDDK